MPEPGSIIRTIYGKIYLPQSCAFFIEGKSIDFISRMAFELIISSKPVLKWGFYHHVYSGPDYGY